MPEPAHSGLRPRLRLYPPVWALISLIMMYVLDRWLPLLQLLAPPYNLWGIAPIAVGLPVMLSARLAFHRARTGVVPFSESKAIITSGLYRFTRNPMYLGLLLVLLGAALLWGSLGALIPVALCALIIDRQFVRREEIFMERVHGQNYLEYKRTARRWL